MADIIEHIQHPSEGAIAARDENAKPFHVAEHVQAVKSFEKKNQDVENNFII